MIHSVTVTSYRGEVLELELKSPEKSGFFTAGIDGLGPVKATINSTENTTGDGERFNSARVGTRNIVLSLFFDGIDVEAKRQETYKFFPVKKSVTLLVKTDHRNVDIKGYVESNEPTIFSSLEGTQISIICPDPYFYKAGEDAITTVNFYGIEPAFEFPFSNESLDDPLLEFGKIVENVVADIYYEGTSETGVTLKMHATGDATNITIYNMDTREFFKIDTTKLQQMTGSVIKEFDEITINTVTGKKGVILLRDGKEYNILNCVDRQSSWFQLTNGINTFSYTAETGSKNLQFAMEYVTKYEGV